MRYRLSTLLTWLVLAPPLLAGVWKFREELLLSATALSELGVLAANTDWLRVVVMFCVALALGFATAVIMWLFGYGYGQKAERQRPENRGNRAGK